MFNYKKIISSFFAMGALTVALIIVFRLIAPYSNPTPPPHPENETANFIFYFESFKNDAYKDRKNLFKTVEKIYKKTSRKLNITFNKKIPIYFVDAPSNGYGHGFAKVSMCKKGDMYLLFCYFPVLTWRQDQDFSFIHPLIPKIEKGFKNAMEEEIIKGLLIWKYLKPQLESQTGTPMFNTIFYEFSTTLGARDVHLGIRWVLNHKADQDFPMRDIIRNVHSEIFWDVVSGKAISFGGYLIENYGFPKYERLLVSGDYKNANDVIIKIYGKSTDALEEEWRHWLKKRYTSYENFDLSASREKHNFINSQYTFGRDIKCDSTKRRFLDAAGVLPALIRIGNYDKNMYQSALALIEKRRDETIKQKFSVGIKE